MVNRFSFSVIMPPPWRIAPARGHPPTGPSRHSKAMSLRPFQYRHFSRVAVHSDEVPCLDHLRALAGSHDSWQPVFPAHNGGMAHGAAHIGHRPRNLDESGRPAWRRRGRHEYLPLLQVGELRPRSSAPLPFLRQCPKNRPSLVSRFPNLLRLHLATSGAHSSSHPRARW